MREGDLPFRLAHKVVATLVQQAVQAGIPSSAVTFAMLQATMHSLGERVPIDETQFQAALDRQHFVEVRNGPGGDGAPAVTTALLVDLADGLQADLASVAAARQRLSQAIEMRNALVQQLVAA